MARELPLNVGGSTMRKRSFATLGILALLAASSAFGQEKLRVDIPFEFYVANVVLPAGQYDVDSSGRNIRNLLILDCFACETQAAALTFPAGGGSDVPTEGRLVFNKYGETYFLSQVWTPGNSYGSALSQSKTERELARATPHARITLPARKTVTLAQR